MKIIWDARSHEMYPVATAGLTSGTVQMINEISKGLAARGHTVHVVTPDLGHEEQRAPTLWYWPREYFPHKADVVVMTMHMDPNPPFIADTLILATFGTDPWMGPNNDFAPAVDAYPVFSQCHQDLLCTNRPVLPEKCHITGLGVTLADYAWRTILDDAGWEQAHEMHQDGCRRKVSGRMLYANDPARGLWHVLDIFDLVKKEVKDATLHVAYDFDRQFAAHMWEHSLMAQLLWDCKKRLESTPGVRNLGLLDRTEVVREQLECQVHVMPSDPPNVGTQIHGIFQMECAAAGAALVLSDREAFPEVFGEGAVILPVIGTYWPEQERRIIADDYATTVVELMTDQTKWQGTSQKTRALAETHTWEHVVDNWERMLNVIRGK